MRGPMIIGRFLLRFILVPLGAGCAILAAVLFVVVANWNRFSAVVEANRGGEEFVVALFLFGSWVMIVAAMSAALMLTPAALGALIAEAFAIRSWIFHVANGGISAWIGLYAILDTREPDELLQRADHRGRRGHRRGLRLLGDCGLDRGLLEAGVFSAATVTAAGPGASRRAAAANLKATCLKANRRAFGPAI